MPRSLRADARRNRTSILDAVRTMVAAHGPTVPMEAIAAEAGVAVGTLYRHYPTKEALLEAALEQLVQAMVIDVETVADRVDAGDPALPSLLSLVDRTLDAATSDHAVKAAANALGRTYPAGLQVRATAALDRLIAAARADGDLRPDVTADDFYLLLDTAPTDAPSETVHRWRQLMIAGLTGRASTP